MEYKKEAEYIYFERKVTGFRKETLERAQAAKLKLEHFYQKQVQDAIERNSRRNELEKRLIQDSIMTQDAKRKQLDQLGRTESSFLRLRRTRLGLDDFRTVKVIGKGAFGEVNWLFLSDAHHCTRLTHSLNLIRYD
jgi:protein-serine/threonine kinase